MPIEDRARRLQPHIAIGRSHASQEEIASDFAQIDMLRGHGVDQPAGGVDSQADTGAGSQRDCDARYVAVRINVRAGDRAGDGQADRARRRCDPGDVQVAGHFIQMDVLHRGRRDRAARSGIDLECVVRRTDTPASAQHDIQCIHIARRIVKGVVDRA